MELAVPSHLIREFAYNPESRTLSVWLFTSDSRYDYLNVPPETHAAFGRAFSKGRYFNAHIRGCYLYRVERPATADGSGRPWLR
jgi:hypothetical protein